MSVRTEQEGPSQLPVISPDRPQGLMSLRLPRRRTAALAAGIGGGLALTFAPELSGIVPPVVPRTFWNSSACSSRTRDRGT